MDSPPPTQPPLMINVNGYTGPERRNEFRLWRDSVDQRLDTGNHAMKGLRLDIDGVKTDTAELVSLMHSVQGAFKVLDLIGKLAKPLGAIVMLCVAIASMFSALKGGGHIK